MDLVLLTFRGYYKSKVQSPFKAEQIAIKISDLYFCREETFKDRSKYHNSIVQGFG